MVTLGQLHFPSPASSYQWKLHHSVKTISLLKAIWITAMTPPKAEPNRTKTRSISLTLSYLLFPCWPPSLPPVATSSSKLGYFMPSGWVPDVIEGRAAASQKSRTFPSLPASNSSERFPFHSPGLVLSGVAAALASECCGRRYSGCCFCHFSYSFCFFCRYCYHYCNYCSNRGTGERGSL